MDVQRAGFQQGRVAYRGKIRFGDINLRFEIIYEYMMITASNIFTNEILIVVIPSSVLA